MLEFNLISADFQHVQLNFTCYPSDAVVVTGKMCLKAAAIDFIVKSSLSFYFNFHVDILPGGNKPILLRCFYS